MHGERAKDHFGKLNWVCFPLHLYPGLKKSLGDKCMAIEAKCQGRSGIEHPSKHVVFLEETPVFFEELFC